LRPYLGAERFSPDFLGVGQSDRDEFTGLGVSLGDFTATGLNWTTSVAAQKCADIYAQIQAQQNDDDQSDAANSTR